MSAEASTKPWLNQTGSVVCAANWTALCGGKEFARAKGWTGTAAGDAGLTIAAVFESASPGKMELIRRKTLHQGLLRQAIDCALKRWEALTQLVENCTLEIDNNLIENAIRPGALGKKNRLFVGHPEAGEAQRGNLHVARQLSAAWVNPLDYLKDLFTRLPATKITQINRFKPRTGPKPN